jgi:site-specific DNA-methyltransferase (adenine-specific)
VMIETKLLQGDCLELMKEIPDKSVDMILCDLPYGQTKFEWDKKLDFILLWEQYERIIKDNGAMVLFGKHPFTSELVLSNLKLFRYELIWEKTRASNSMQVKKQPSAIHENILVFYKKQPTYNDLKFKVDEKYIDKRKSINDSFYNKGHYQGVMKRKADDGWRHPQSILPFNSVWKKDMHPTEKPIELLEWLINAYTNENDIVLDNCMGSGSTGIACVNTNRNFIGIELDEQYFNIAKERIENAEKQCFQMQL